MKKNIVLVIILISLFIMIYPNIEFIYKDKLYLFTYGKEEIDSKDFEILDNNLCYNETYSYVKNRNITIVSHEYKGFLFFKYFKMKYKDGNLCNIEYLLEEKIIKRIIEESIITVNPDNINLKKMIENKRAIVSNKKYSWNETYNYIEYKLDNKYEEMYIYYDNELLVIQVGNRDENPKFIAYK